MNPNNPDVLYAATQNSKVWKSTDGGDNWQQKASGIPATIVRHLAVSASNPSVVYAATDDGVYKTTNGGGSWTKKNSGVSGSQASIAVDPTDSGTAFVGTETGLFRTTDGGSNWSASQSGIPSADRDVRSLLIDPGHPAKVYAGTDPGGRVRLDRRRRHVDGPELGPRLPRGLRPGPGPLEHRQAVRGDPGRDLPLHEPRQRVERAQHRAFTGRSPTPSP